MVWSDLCLQGSLPVVLEITLEGQRNQWELVLGAYRSCPERVMAASWGQQWGCRDLTGCWVCFQSRARRVFWPTQWELWGKDKSQRGLQVSRQPEDWNCHLLRWRSLLEEQDYGKKDQELHFGLVASDLYSGHPSRDIKETTGDVRSTSGKEDRSKIQIGTILILMCELSAYRFDTTVPRWDFGNVRSVGTLIRAVSMEFEGQKSTFKRQ